MNTNAVSNPQLPPCDYQPPEYKGPSKEEVIKTRKQFCNPAIFTYYKDPLLVADGKGQYLFDETGRRYLDFFAGIVTVSCGHCHPKINEAVKKQLDQVQHTTTIYLHPNFPNLAKKLASKMPEGLDVTYFTNSGSEANDLAIMMARLFTGNEDVVALRNSYHGASPGAMGLTSHHTWKYSVQQGGRVHHAINPDPYRSPFSGTPEEIADKSVEDIHNLIQYSTPGCVSAFIAEPIQGVGGATMGAKNYLKKAYELTRRHGGLCISDEVQTGFGRTGENYWGFQNWDVIPDIVTTAKGFGNGFPLAAVTTRREIAEVLTQKIHFNTYGGNPISMAAGAAVLDVIDEEGLQENCKVIGNHLINGLNKLAEKFPIIGDVRGMGLMLGVELVKDRETKEPAKEETAEIVEEAKKLGLLLGKGGLFGSILRIKPPMCITKKDADFALEVIENVLAKI